MKILCPDCGSTMVLRQTKKYKFRNGANRVFYGCSQYPECKGIRPSHPDGTVYGVPADQETKEWRMKAHAEFDKLWKQYGYTRHQSYDLLATIMKMTRDQAHISNFTKEDCEKLINRLKIYLKK